MAGLGPACAAAPPPGGGTSSLWTRPWAPLPRGMSAGSPAMGVPQDRELAPPKLAGVGGGLGVQWGLMAAARSPAGLTHAPPVGHL